MESAIVSFDSIVLDVMDETGITNLANKKPMLRRMISNAEKDINPYSTFFVWKTVKFYKGGPWFDGKALKKPDDFMELDKVGSCKNRLCPGSYIETNTHIILCKDTPQESIVISYFAINCDGHGNPVTSENHRRAVVAYIIWKLNAQKIFINNGSVRYLQYYEETYNTLARASRGHDFFPSDEEWEEMFATNMMDSREINNRTWNSMSTVSACCCLGIIETEKPDKEDGDNTENNPQVYFGQFKSIQHTGIDTELANEIINKYPNYDVNDIYAADRNKLSELQNGKPFHYDYVGRYFFIIDGDSTSTYEIYDILGIVLNGSLNFTVDSINNRIIIVSNFYISPSTIFLKFVKV